ncbi:AAA family ATPase [Methylocucumis oryzae]|uniref:AAA+ ATPase domain-containing protein n=1 Tax=Methylocucumis oryzae TaxID=1632867 RepID=A0A0F3IM99_9GAMM|nr:ATP-binding protein [Methylocucumis oryzae]KJV06664.1 hypothetical protein VZ94_09665 [Methylocucumis oryzae]
MVETDTFTYSKKKPDLQQTPEQLLLITPERSQKLDLLIHLITNLPQALVVCGPKGIGKTALLNALLDRKLDNWLYCQVSANAELSFESLQERLNQVFKSGKQSSLSQELLRIQSINRKLVLLIDNAGSLVPGLFTAIIQFAWANPALRIVFAMTPDDVHVKSSTDHLINDCHFVEIPPLSEPQCGVFLQQLAVKSWPQLPLGAINEELTRQVYTETHGIPGQIIAALPALTKRKRSISSFAWLMMAVVVLVGLA